MFFRLLLESFRRQRRRKLLAGIAILLGATAVAAMLALATTIGDRIHAELAVYGANIVVTPQAQALAVNIGGVTIQPATGNAFLHESDLAKLRTIFWANNVTAISPELPVNLLEDHTSKVIEIQAIGLWFHHVLGPQNSSINTGVEALHPLWKLDGQWPAALDQAVLGSTLAGTLHLQVGDILPARTDPSQWGPGDRAIPPGKQFTITGIVHTGDTTDSNLLIPLATAQTFNNTPDAVSRIEISARTRPEDSFARQNPDTLSPKQHEIWYCRPYANSIAYQIREAIPNSDAQQVRRVEQSEGNVLKRISGLMWLISAAALLAAGFAVSAATATAVLERRTEIGLMRSLGASRGSIATLFYVEAAILALAAGAGGYLAGSALAAWLGNRIFNQPGLPGSPLSPLHGAPVFNPVLLPIVAALALLVAIAGSTPAIRSALKLDPSSILRADA